MSAGQVMRAARAAPVVQVPPRRRMIGERYFVVAAQAAAIVGFISMVCVALGWPS